MRIYTGELERLKSAKAVVREKFPHFGINKKQEITRLLYEISKRENISPLRLIGGVVLRDYDGLKAFLLKERYPYASTHDGTLSPYLPKVELKPSDFFLPEKTEFYPKEIFVEKKAAMSFLAGRLKECFPLARFSAIESFKEYECAHRGLRMADCNRRKEKIFLVTEKYDFFKKCPCSKNTFACGYHIFNLGFGCIFECSYCFLQGYANSPGIILPANIGRFFDAFHYHGKRKIRLGTGEFSDSLALDEITGYSIPIIEFFRKQKGAVFEFKTKSKTIGNILRIKGSRNIVVSWSINPQCVIDENEYFTASLKERLFAAARCVAAGYKVGFHFDPIIYFHGWEQEYGHLIEELFSRIKPKDIAWISLGTFRFTPALKQVIERRFPLNKILDEELLLGYDNKLRYPFSLRRLMYKKMFAMLSGYSRALKVYLCMEEALMWRSLTIKMPRLP